MSEAFWTARELLSDHKVRCRCCLEAQDACEVVITETARKDPDDGAVTGGRTARVTLMCHACIEETSADLLL